MEVTQNQMDVLGLWMIWFILGALFLYLVGEITKKVTNSIMPSMLMIIGCIMLGAIVYNAVF